MLKQFLILDNKLPAINYKENIDLNKEIKHLDALIKTDDIKKISHFCDKVLREKLGYIFDNEQYEKILGHLQQIRIKNK